MSRAYINAVRTHLPEATVVFDRFHVVKLMNDKLSSLMRSLQRQAEAEAKEVLKGELLAAAEESPKSEGGSQRDRAPQGGP